MSKVDVETVVPPRKKRETITKIACTYCRKQHRRCDGENPCNNCKKKGIECIYIARRKRKQQPKRKRATKDSTDQPAASSIEVEEPAQKRTKEQNMNVFADVPLYLSSLLINFVEADLKLHPIIPQNFTSRIPYFLNLMVTNKIENPSEMFLFYASLAICTREGGNAVLAEDFHNKARLLAGELFDSSEYAAGCGFCLLSLSSYYKDEYLKAMSYVQIAKRICKFLNAQDTSLYRKSLLYHALMETSVESRFQLYKEMNTPGKSLTQLDDIMSNLGIVECELFSRTPNFLLALSVLEKYNKILHGENSDSLPYITSVRIFCYGIMAMILQKSGFHEQAIEWANSAAEQIGKGRICIHALVHSMEYTITVHTANSMWKEFQNDLALLKQYTNIFPIVKTLYSRFATPTQNEIVQQIQPAAQQPSVPLNGHTINEHPNNFVPQVNESDIQEFFKNTDVGIGTIPNAQNAFTMQNVVQEDINALYDTYNQISNDKLFPETKIEDFLLHNPKENQSLGIDELF